MGTAKLRKDDFPLFLGKLNTSHKVIGPRIEQDVIILDEIQFSDIPAGMEDHQKEGGYRLLRGDRLEIFSFSVGPDSFKRFLHPPVSEVHSFKRSGKGVTVAPLTKEERPLAFLEMRACDLSALQLYDRIFLQGPVRDPEYASLRKNSLVVTLNCLYPNANCFCDSMGTGPEVKEGFDIALTELSNSFLLEIRTGSGQMMLDGLPTEEVTDSDMNEKRMRIQNCRTMIKKTIRSDDLPWLLRRNPDHPRWAAIAKRDLECGNCTQVCPTCFCSSTYDALRLSSFSRKAQDISGVRMRKWDSCFSRNFARVHGGNFRPSRRARYRHWISHKFAYTLEQFGITGCVGCGRCITWCPAGIDVTRELEGLRNVQ